MLLCAAFIDSLFQYAQINRVKLQTLATNKRPFSLLSTPMGVDYVVIGFGMEVQPLVTHNAA